MLWITAAASLRFYNAFANSPIATIVDGTPSAIAFSDDGTGAADAAKLFVDNLSVPVNTSVTRLGASLPADRFNLGDDAAIIAVKFSGTMAEAIFFPGILSPADKVNLVHYLNVTRAYGIAVS